MKIRNCFLSRHFRLESVVVAELEGDRRNLFVAAEWANLQAGECRIGCLWQRSRLVRRQTARRAAFGAAAAAEWPGCCNSGSDSDFGFGLADCLAVWWASSWPFELNWCSSAHSSRPSWSAAAAAAPQPPSRTAAAAAPAASCRPTRAGSSTRATGQHSFGANSQSGSPAV